MKFPFVRSIRWDSLVLSALRHYGRDHPMKKNPAEVRASEASETIDKVASNQRWPPQCGTEEASLHRLFGQLATRRGWANVVFVDLLLLVI